MKEWGHHVFEKMCMFTTQNSLSRSTRLRISFWRHGGRMRGRWKSRGAGMSLSLRFDAPSICTRFVSLILRKPINWSNLFLPVWVFKTCRGAECGSVRLFIFLLPHALDFVACFYILVIVMRICLFFICYENAKVLFWAQFNWIAHNFVVYFIYYDLVLWLTVCLE